MVRSMETESGSSTVLPWRRPEWRAEAEAWIRNEVRRLGLVVTGEVGQPHVVWWSTVLRVPTSRDTLWFKATQPDGAHEARLAPLLASLRPAESVEIVALDAERGWTLARDAGVRLREIGGDIAPVDHWANLLPRYAELQIDLAGRRDELLALGVPDLRLGVLPGALRAVLGESELLRLDATGGLSTAERDRTVGQLAEFAGLCRRLSDFGIPETLQHDDLHDGNVFVREGRYVLFDWGDSCVSHPFHTLAVTLRALAHRHGWAPGGQEVARLRDAYLGPWSRWAPHDDLVEAAGLALRTGTIQRALSWHRVLAAMPPAVRAGHVDTISYGLRLYLKAGPFGTWDDGSS